MLVGIAKQAAEASLLESKRRVEYRELETRRYITRCNVERMPFAWTINPYRGCEFGCKYCYARYTHEFMELRDPKQFEEKIFAKKWDEAEFRKELLAIPHGQQIALGTATDPYQPAERRYGVTRKMLEVFARSRGRQLGIITKGDLVARDADVLAEIGRNNDVGVTLTITTMDEALARSLEPYAPRPALRVEAMAKLSAAGVPCGAQCSPLLPLINDSEQSIDAVGKAAAGAGAIWFHGHALFLKPCAKEVFFPFMEEHFPKLARRYHERYDHEAYLSGEYPKLVRERILAVRERYAMNGRVVRYPEPEQLGLF